MAQSEEHIAVVLSGVALEELRALCAEREWDMVIPPSVLTPAGLLGIRSIVRGQLLAQDPTLFPTPPSRTGATDSAA